MCLALGAGERLAIGFWCQGGGSGVGHNGYGKGWRDGGKWDSNVSGDEFGWVKSLVG